MYIFHITFQTDFSIQTESEIATTMNVIHIGVTGHRVLPHYELTAKSIREVITKIEESDIEGGHKISKLVILSPLAEGADRLVAKEVLKRPESSLEVALPLEAADYIKDFHTEESKSEFNELMNQADKVHNMPLKDTRHEAYEAAGHFVVDNCDIVIAIWNGNTPNGKGGTSTIVAYARQQEKPLYWINTENPGKVIEERRG